MQIIRAGFGHHVDDGAAGPAKLRRVSIRVHLKFLYRILAELEWRTAGSGTSGGLAEECVVIVCAIDDQAVHRSALAGKTDVAGADIASHAGREKNEVDEVTAVHRKVRDCPVVNGGTHLCSSRFHHRNFFSYGNSLRRPGNREPNVQLQGLSDRESDGGLFEFCEACELN